MAIESKTGLEIHQLHYAYPPRHRHETATPVLDGVNLEVTPGQVQVLLGASGCGKSTLLQVVAGLLEPQQGTVKWDGQDLGKTPVHRRGFTLLFQDGQLFNHRDVWGNIAYGLQMMHPRLSREQISGRVAQMLELVHLQGFEHRPVGTLSGGQAGRVALARALAPQPRLLLLDEPLAALDQDLRFDLGVDIKRICHETATAAIYVTHDRQEAALAGDRIAQMEAGRVVRNQSA